VPAVSIGAALLLSACGGGGDTPAKLDPLLSYKQQKVDWKVCDPSIVEDVASFAKPGQLEQRVRCAEIRVPLDYLNVARGDATIAVLKFSAGEPAQRKGMIVFNPGGPGADGLIFGAFYGLLWANTNPEHRTGAMLKTLSDSYDLVGFSPRGVGSSSQLRCGTNEKTRVVNNPSVDRSEQNIDNMLHNASLVARACQKNPMTEYVHTDGAARDMDIIRAVSGDEKLNYIGYSYGTWLGAWYAGLFPEHTGRMLLDSSMKLTGTFEDNQLLQFMARQRVLDEVLAPLAASNDPAFNLGTTVDAVRQVLPSLPLALHSAFASALPTSNSRGVVDAILTLTAAKGLKTLLELNPQADQSAIDMKIGSHPFTDLQATDEIARNIAHTLNEAYFEELNAQPKSVSLLANDSVFQSVACNDTPIPMDRAYWIDKGNEFARKYPLAGGNLTSNPCLFWQRPAVNKPSLMSMPMLMVQSEFDAATAVEGARDSFAAMPNASLIFVRNEYQHGLFPYDSDCVDFPVARYLVEGSLPRRETTCQGNRLPALDPALRAQPRSNSASAYADPPRANRLVDRIHQVVERNRIRF
jgi:pimeloyl-ACP methyl ester carboxylesterase